MAADRPPLPELDYVEAVEAAVDAICASPNCIELSEEDTEALAAQVIEAVWPVLHPVAYAAGRNSVLDHTTEVFAFDNGPGGPFPISAGDAAALRSPTNRARLRHAYRTEWQPADGGAS